MQAVVVAGSGGSSKQVATAMGSAGRRPHAGGRLTRGEGQHHQPVAGRRRFGVRSPAVPILALIGLLVAGCTDALGAGSEQDRLVVATTVAPLTSIAAAIGGDRVEIEGIVPEGTNSHTFEPAPKVAELLSRADLVLTNGLQLENPTEDLAKQNMKDDAELVELGTTVLPESDYIFDFSFPREEGKPNPH